MFKYSTILVSALTALTAAFSHGAGFETLTHHWNFDEGPDWHDDPFLSVCTVTAARDNVGTGHATLQGMDASAWVSGRQYTGLSFDGADDSLLTATDLSADLSGTSSFSFWLKTTQTGAASSANAPGILGSSGIQWGWLDTDGKIVFSVNGTPVVRTAGAVNDGAWHHIILTRNSSTGTAQVFLDGQLSATAAGPTGTQSGALTRIGQMQNGSTASFHGRLDQIHVFSDVVDAATIASLFDNHAPKTWAVTSTGESSAPFTTDSVLINTYAYDAEQDTLSVASFTQPAHGSVTYNGDTEGTFTYTAIGGFTGSDSFTVIITDGRGGFTTNTVNIVSLAPMPGAGNRTTTFTDFQAIQAGGVDIALSNDRVPRALDWDADGDLDLLIGHSSGIWRYENTGTPTAPVFAAGVRVQANGSNIYLSGDILIALSDMTGDGVDDLVVVSGSDRKIRTYRNTSAAGQVPVYAAAAIAQSSAGGDFELPDQRFDSADWDGDGLVDIVMGTYNDELRAYRNVGTAAAPLFDPNDYEVLEKKSYNLCPRIFDINRNGTLDYLRGVNWGGAIKYWFDPSRYTGVGNKSGELTITYPGGGQIDMKALTNGAIVDFADFNDDGILDILIGGHSGSLSYIAYGVAKTVAMSIADIEAIYDAHPTGLGAALEADSQALLNEIKAAESNIIMHMDASTLSERQGYFAQMVVHVGKYAFLQMGSPVDTTEYHHLPSIAGQNLMTMHKMLPSTPAHRTAVADAVGLTGLHREIYLQMGLHVGDNQHATQGQLESIRDFMRLQPRESFPDSVLTLGRYYDDERAGFVSTFRGSKNTFDFGEGDNESEWDSDLQNPIRAFYGAEVDRGDYFTFVMGHEVTHSLDGYVDSRANKDLWRRKGQWLTLAAGADVLSANGDNHDWKDWDVTKARFQSQGYWDGDSATWSQAWDDYWTTGPGSLFKGVATMRIDSEFFLKTPQEALATQANHHWAHAEGRLIAALDRWQRGVDQGVDPMKANLTEVFTFLDWISCGMNRIVMQDTEGVTSPYMHAEYHTTHAWVERNDKGYITKVTTSGRTYEVTLDDFGIVTDVIKAPTFQKDDTVTVIRDTPNIIKPLENDQSVGSSLSIDSFTQPAHGTLVDEGNGVLLYTPTAGYTGTDSFIYKTSPGNPSSTVSILVKAVADAQPGILMETWYSITGASVSNLTGHANYPHNPSASEVQSLFEAPGNRGSDFGTRMSALLVPQVTGEYTFWIASNDHSELWLADSRTGANTIRIASVSGYTSSRQWTKYTSQQSAPVTLQAGKAYHIMALHKAGAYTDNLAIAWQGPGITQDVIPSSALQTIDIHAPAVAAPVADVTVVENAANTVLDISSVFSDQDIQDSIGTEITGNTTPSLVTTTLVGNQLTLAYPPGQLGATTITLRGYDIGGATVTTTFTVTVLADSDSDGMPDAWESAHGLNPGTDDAADNKDGDQFDNYSEYVADTNPSDPNSELSLIVEVAAATSDRALRFLSSPSRRYTVETCDDLGTWLPLASSVNGTGDEIIIQDATALPHRFYRLRVELP